MAMRSPKNPSLNLADAIEKARLIYDQEHRNPISREAIAELIGYRGLSGASMRSISALRQYGLIEGRGEESRLSEDSITVFADEEVGSPERAVALRNMLDNPSLFQELNGNFAQLPSQANLRSFLEKRGFSRKAADKAAVIYRASVEFVNAGTTGYDSAVSEPAADSGDNVAQLPPANLARFADMAVMSKAALQPTSSFMETDGLSEIEYIRVSKQTGIRILADGPYSAKNIEAVVKRLSDGLEQGLYDELVQDDVDKDIS